MPFTPAHAAAVLPLRRTGLPLAALVCGAMSPDLPYYTPAVPWLSSASGLTHSLHGTVLADIPIAVVLLGIWTLLTPPLVALAPHDVRARVVGLRAGWSWWVVPATWFGALTHVGWDYWTHDYGFFVRHIALLRRSVGHDLRVYNVLQQVSTAVGLLILGVAVTRWSMRTPPRVVPTGLAPTVRLAVLAALASLTAAWTLRRALVPFGWGLQGMRLARAVATQAAEGLVIGAGAGVAAYAIAWWLLTRLRAP